LKREAMRERMVLVEGLSSQNALCHVVFWIVVVLFSGAVVDQTLKRAKFFPHSYFG
jgi:hypothetical protein